MAGRFDPMTAMYLVREALEGVMHPNLASSIVFEAMVRGGISELPNDLEAFSDFVHGPLREATAHRIGASDAAALSSQLSLVVERAAGPWRSSADERATARMDVSAGPVRVLVASKGKLAVWLRAALSGDSVAVRSVADVATASDVVPAFTPLLGILDANALPHHADVDSIARWVASLPVNGRVVWGAENAAAGAVVAALEREGTVCTSIDSRESVEPLVDLIRSRRVSLQEEG